MKYPTFDVIALPLCFRIILVTAFNFAGSQQSVIAAPPKPKLFQVCHHGSVTPRLAFMNGGEVLVTCGQQSYPMTDAEQKAASANDPNNFVWVWATLQGGGDKSQIGSKVEIKLWDTQSNSLLANLGQLKALEKKEGKEGGQEAISTEFGRIMGLLSQKPMPFASPMAATSHGTLLAWPFQNKLAVLDFAKVSGRWLVNPRFGKSDIIAYSGLSLPIPDIYGVAFSPDGKLLAGARLDEGNVPVIEVWDLQTSRLIGCWNAAAPKFGRVSFQFVPGKRQIITAADFDSIREWDATGRPLRAWETSKEVSTTRGFVRVSPDGTTAARVHRDELTIYDYRTNRVMKKVLLDPNTEATSAVFVGKTAIAIGGKKATTRFMDLETGQKVGEFVCHNGKGIYIDDARIVDTVVSPDGKWFACVNGDGIATVVAVIDYVPNAEWPTNKEPKKPPKKNAPSK